MFVIVKHASTEAWSFYHDTDPKNGVSREASAHSTYSGKCANLQSSYEDKAKALQDLHKIMNLNPSGNYAICPVN